jgi:beta-phosphoglucomutase
MLNVNNLNFQSFDYQNYRQFNPSFNPNSHFHTESDTFSKSQNYLTKPVSFTALQSFEDKEVLFPEVKAVIFDLDGVIVDTEGIYYDTWSRIAKEEEGINLPSEYYYGSLKATGQNNVLIKMLALKYPEINNFTPDELKEFQSTPKFKDYLDKKARYLSQGLSSLSEADILPGAKELIKGLKERGIKIAIGSSSISAPVVLRKLGLYDEFATIVDGNQISKSKPDPEVFLKAAQRLNVDPEHCLVIEDSQVGVDAAKSVGMKCIGVVPSLKETDCNVNGLDEVDIDKYFSDLNEH